MRTTPQHYSMTTERKHNIKFSWWKPHQRHEIREVQTTYYAMMVVKRLWTKYHYGDFCLGVFRAAIVKSRFLHQCNNQRRDQVLSEPSTNQTSNFHWKLRVSPRPKKARMSKSDNIHESDKLGVLCERARPGSCNKTLLLQTRSLACSSF